ncbi:uncharacterized protein LOC133839982 [Drosophila sulfurigaster albostrigata]|uniref:uncharacterized protein LOC133839982 n=1 Tax=Drosophila sulfurigaster albostrigata TaxID=89887 RepID=UPI002D21CED6|nr:uncharacterized protein LOC133839982 [Drosophila sulfurigaster albostrigata]
MASTSNSSGRIATRRTTATSINSASSSKINNSKLESKSNKMNTAKETNKKSMTSSEATRSEITDKTTKKNKTEKAKTPTITMDDGTSKENVNGYSYNENHKGPYAVYLEKNLNGNSGAINSIELAAFLSSKEIEGIEEIRKMGYGRCKVVCNSAQAANNLAYCGDLLAGCYEPKIPRHLVNTAGIIFNIPLNLSDSDILKNIKSDITIDQVERIMKKSRIDGQLIPTGRVKLWFNGAEIPKEIKLMYSRLSVQPFIYFCQCFCCFRFGHLAKHCKSKARCFRCGLAHDKQDPCGPTSCVNCKEQHVATDPNCPARIKEYSIKKIMASENMSRKDAKTKFPSIFQKASPPPLDALNFPQLPKQIGNPRSARSSNSSLQSTPVQSFSNPTPRHHIAKFYITKSQMPSLSVNSPA